MNQRAPLALAVLISGRGSNLLAIASACAGGALRARIVSVIADRPAAAGIERARALGLPVTVLDYRSHATRAAFEQALAGSIDASGAAVIVLAGFMRILSPEFTARYAGRVLNIHPALLPAYKGLHTHERVLAAGDTRHGASVHYVTGELDGGPVIMQGVVPVERGDTVESLSARVQQQEHSIYPEVLGLIAEGRLEWREERAWLDGKPLTAPLQRGWH